MRNQPFPESGKIRHCSICDTPTIMACYDCAIDIRTVVYVCSKAECREAHDGKCSTVLKSRAETAETRLSKAVEALQLIYDKYENGTSCYEDPEDFSGRLGNAVRLSAEEEDGILRVFESFGIPTALRGSK